MGDQMNIGENLRALRTGVRAGRAGLFEQFDFLTEDDRLQKGGLLYLVTWTGPEDAALARLFKASPTD